ncbi:probable glutathione S-transferase 5 [Stylophora pistillata]|uniref:Putative glutathione S-transferase 5 n=1 Tax=Stylophora pistillata TaxID=50429 RepID=A0A2B4RHI9_STYPI|nr:probable glutathione S-transferase 5 [Stylophora pistillata]PFX16269.1 putative glutathione S-transferase 5 [Stylophora pistillata]
MRATPARGLHLHCHLQLKSGQSISQTNMPSYKLTYFDIRGRGESTRLIFKAAGVEFEDNRVTFEEWGALKASAEFPFGQLPVLEVDGVVLAQSFSIARFVANEFGLAPSTNLDKAKADMIADGVADLGQKHATAFLEKDPARKAKLEEEAKVATPRFLTYFEKLLKANNEGKGFFVGDKLTYADIIFFNITNGLLAKGKMEVPALIKDFPLLASHYERVMAIPNIKNWLETRPESAM